MFDLEQQIASWREQFVLALPNRSDVLDELESHLRDETDRLIRAGQSPEQAWQIATAKLGDAKTMAEEFAKTSPSPWLPARLSLSILITCALILAVTLASRLPDGITRLLAFHIFTLTSGYLATLALGIAGICAAISRAAGRVSAGQSDTFRKFGVGLSRAAIALTFLGILLGMVWSQIHRGPRWQLEPREITALSVLAWNCLTLRYLRLRERNISETILIAIAGNLFVALAWLGPVFVNPSHPAWIGPTLVAFATTHLACLCVALLPPGRLAGHGE